MPTKLERIEAMEQTVWVVEYDSGMYGSGVSGVFSTQEKAKAYVAKKGEGYTTYTIEECKVDEEN